MIKNHHNYHHFRSYKRGGSLETLFVAAVASLPKVLLRLSVCGCCFFTQAQINNCQVLLKEREK